MRTQIIIGGEERRLCSFCCTQIDLTFDAWINPISWRTHDCIPRYVEISFSSCECKQLNDRHCVSFFHSLIENLLFSNGKHESSSFAASRKWGNSWKLVRLQSAAVFKYSVHKYCNGLSLHFSSVVINNWSNK